MNNIVTFYPTKWIYTLWGFDLDRNELAVQTMDLLDAQSGLFARVGVQHYQMELSLDFPELHLSLCTKTFPDSSNVKVFGGHLSGIQWLPDFYFPDASAETLLILAGQFQAVHLLQGSGNP